MTKTNRNTIKRSWICLIIKDDSDTIDNEEQFTEQLIGSKMLTNILLEILLSIIDILLSNIELKQNDNID